jgi:phosphoribosylamine---glycine ligase
MKTIVIGSGGREHAIAWALSRSSSVEQIICMPGNGGTEKETRCRNISIHVNETQKIVEECVREIGGRSDGSMVVIGPEDPLVAGLSDRLNAAGLRVVGPKRDGALLEGSKDAAKAFMKKYGVACAKSETYDDPASAIRAIEAMNGPIVVKADGLAAGKGVVVAPDPATAIAAVRDFMEGLSLGDAGRKVVLEEYLEGEESSILAAVSVTPALSREGRSTIVPFVSARDHKRLRDGAKGPNTGGMGAIAPAQGVDEAVLARFRKDILEPTLKGLIAENWDYRGFIFFGVMVTKDGPKLLEYNVRLGDPETQAVLPLMDFDFASMCAAIVDGTLSSFPFAWKSGYSCAPVVVSFGYPGPYQKGIPIGIDTSALDASGARLFVAGATVDHRQVRRPGREVPEEGSMVTSGGRVLSCSALGATVGEARDRAYAGLKSVSFDGMFYRKDIGLPGAAVSGNLTAES